MRFPSLMLLVGALGGCAQHEIRGQLVYDLRPAAERDESSRSRAAANNGRYRYVGALVGQQNFQRSASAPQSLSHTIDAQAPLTLQSPRHGMVDENGRIYVADPGLHALLVFDPHPPAGGGSDQEGGRLLVWDELGSGVRFDSPVAVAQAWNGDIAVSDAALGAVFWITKKGKFVAAIGEGELQRPGGIAFDPQRGLLFVADTAANNIKVFDAVGHCVYTIGKPGRGALDAPTMLTLAGNHLYVTDTLNSRIQVYQPDGAYVRSIGHRGNAPGNLSRPSGVAVARDGGVYVAESDGASLLVFDKNAHFLAGIDGSGTRNGRFHLPSGVWTDDNGKVFVADASTGRVTVFQFGAQQSE